MKKIRITENDINRMVNRSVRIIKEAYDMDTYGDEADELEETLQETYSAYVDAMKAIQQFNYEHDEYHPDSMYNSYAGKYGDEALQIARESYNKIVKLLPTDNESDEY